MYEGDHRQEILEVESSFVPTLSKSQPETRRKSTGRANSADPGSAIEPELYDLLSEFFEKLDGDGGGTVSKSEAVAFWGKNGAKANTTTLFSQIETDEDDEISFPMFVKFFKSVIDTGKMTSGQLMDEVVGMMRGGSWTAPKLKEGDATQLEPRRAHWSHRILPPAFRILTNWHVELLSLSESSDPARRSLRVKAYRFLASPVSSTRASYLSLTILLVAIGSIVSFAVENTNEAHALRASLANGSYDAGDYVSPKFEAWNIFVVSFFTLELIARLVVYRRPWEDVMIWIDVFCYLPLLVRFIVDYAGNGRGVLSLYVSQKGVGVLLVLTSSTASFRMFKMTQHLLGTHVLLDTLRRSFTALVVPVYLLFLLVTFFGTLIFAVEFDPTGQCAGCVPDVSTSWWMLLVTMTTVGYGDYSPQTTTGRMLISVAMMAGLVVVAMPLTIVGSTFEKSWDNRTIVLIGERVREHLVRTGELSGTAESLVDEPVKTFRVFDVNRMGMIDYHEFKYVVTETLGLALPNWRLRFAWKAFDLLETNEVSFSEFTSVLFPTLDEDDLTKALDRNADYKKKVLAAEKAAAPKTSEAAPQVSSPPSRVSRAAESPERPRRTAAGGSSARIEAQLQQMAEEQVALRSAQSATAATVEALDAKVERLSANTDRLLQGIEALLAGRGGAAPAARQQLSC